MIVRLNGQFDAKTQAALREGLDWVAGPVVIDLKNAWLTATALGEIMLLASRIGSQNVALADPTPVMRRILALTHIDRVLRVTDTYKKSA